jgi:hypothetical protein
MPLIFLNLPWCHGEHHQYLSTTLKKYLKPVHCQWTPPFTMAANMSLALHKEITFTQHTFFSLSTGGFILIFLDNNQLQEDPIPNQEQYI